MPQIAGIRKRKFPEMRVKYNEKITLPQKNVRVTRFSDIRGRICEVLMVKGTSGVHLMLTNVKRIAEY